jgi:hypothetical protein
VRLEKVGQLWASGSVVFAEYCQSKQITMDEIEGAGETRVKAVLVGKSEGKRPLSDLRW